MSSYEDMIKVIFFDATGTLIRLPKGVGWHYRLVARRHGLELDELALNAAFVSAWKTMPARPPTREPRPDDDKGWWRELVGRVLDSCAAPAPASFDRDAYFEELYAHFTTPGVWALYPEVESVLGSLAGRYRFGVISNFDRRLRALLDQLGIARRFEHLAISSEVGANKPDAFIFESALEKMGVQPHEALHVGDDPVHDWQGAEAMGIRCFRLDRDKNSLRDLEAWLVACVNEIQ
jgi:putative hydrolase of the HAD superfamily